MNIHIAFDEQIEAAKKHDEDGHIALVVSVFEQLIEDGYDQVYPYTYLKERYMIEGNQEGERCVVKAFNDLVESLQVKGINRPDLAAAGDEVFAKI